MRVLRSCVMPRKMPSPGAPVDYLGRRCRAARPPLTSPTMATAAASPSVGPLLRDWLKRRRLSQLDLALDAGVSARHLSFVETGRAKPSREMVLHLAEQL